MKGKKESVGPIVRECRCLHSQRLGESESLRESQTESETETETERQRDTVRDREREKERERERERERRRNLKGIQVHFASPTCHGDSRMN